MELETTFDDVKLNALIDKRNTMENRRSLVVKLLNELHRELVYLNDHLQENSEDISTQEHSLESWARMMLTFDNYRITLYGIKSLNICEIRGTLAEHFRVKINYRTGKIMCFLWNNPDMLAEYSSVKNFKEAILKLKTAIENKNSSFEFPKDVDIWDLKL